MGHSTFASIFQATAARAPDAVAVRTRHDEVRWTWGEYNRRVRALAAGFSRLGVQRGETVALMLTNRPEFHVADAAAMHLGAVPWSIYNSYPTEQIAHLLADADTNVVVTEQAMLATVQKAAAAAMVEHVVVVDGEACDGAIALADVATAGDPSFDFEAQWRAVQPQDLLTVIYTSGTTGPPKGVQLTHASVLAAIEAFIDVWRLPDEGRFVSWLPMAHIAERLVTQYAPMVLGSAVTTCPDGREIAAYLPDVRPSYFFSVPRIWEKLKARLDAELAAEPDPERRRFVEEALNVGRRRVRALQAAGAVPASLQAEYERADQEVLAGLRHRLGLDRAALGVTGAAPCPYEVIEFFHAIGIHLAEVYGLSEASGVGTHNRVGHERIGTVGPPMAGVELALADDGEVLMRGAAIMAGYRNRPDATTEAIDADGWLHTGDVGSVDREGFLRIVDRKKELIINAAGKNMSPANIEAALKASSELIDQAVAIGDRRPYNVALITLEPIAARLFARDRGITAASTAELAGEAAVIEELARAVSRANDRLARVEQIKRFRLIADEWEPGGDELTPTHKLKRRQIVAKYAEQIEAIYATEDDAAHRVGGEAVYADEST
jgi:long-subunit acyl-CoA synthetase (AMP-forming)